MRLIFFIIMTTISSYTAQNVCVCLKKIIYTIYINLSYLMSQVEGIANAER